MALNIKDFKKECKKELLDKELMTLAFNSSIKFYNDMLNNIDAQLEKNNLAFENLRKAKLVGYDDKYFNWYKEHLLNKDNLIAYIKENLTEIETAKEQTLEVIDTTDYGKAVRDLLNENNTKLKYNTFALLDGMSVTNYVFLTSVFICNKADTKDTTLINCTYSVATKNSTFYNELLADKEFNEKDQDYKDLCMYLIGINTKVKDKLKELELQENYIQIQLPLPLEYSSIATITDTQLLNQLETQESNNLALFDSETLRELTLLNKYDYSLNTTTIKQSEEKINALNELDRFVLDTIVVDLFYKQGITLFTDRQLAEWYTQKGGKVRPSENIQAEINKSIIKLSKTYIDIDYKSVQEFKKNKHIEVTRHNPLIWVKNLGVKDDSKTNNYKLIETPFYYNYLQHTDSKITTINRELYYLDIKGIDKSLENQNLRRYLIRRIAPLGDNNLDIYIPMAKIYEVQNATAKYYPKDANLRKAKQRARERAELILDELKKEYSFYYRLDNANKRFKGYYIKPKKIKNREM